MKIQLAYRVTGERKEEVVSLLSKIKTTLENNKHQVWIPILDKEAPSDRKQLLLKTFSKLDTCDSLVVLMKSEEKSEGMLLEVGYAIGKKKKIILFAKKDVKNTSLIGLADKVIKFEDEEELIKEIKEI